MRIPVYQRDSGEVQVQDIPIPTIGDKPSVGEVYSLRNGIMLEKLAIPAMNLIEFMTAYPDAICKKIITSTEPAVYQFESLEHGVAIYLKHNPSKKIPPFRG